MFPLMRAMQYIQTFRQNPNQISEFLLQQGKITRAQYDDIQRLGIGSNPEAIGQYLMNQGTMNRQQVQDAYQNQAVPIHNSMGQN